MQLSALITKLELPRTIYYDEFFGSPQKNFANERGFDFLDRRTDRGQTDRRTDGQEFCGNFG